MVLVSLGLDFWWAFQESLFNFIFSDVVLRDMKGPNHRVSFDPDDLDARHFEVWE